MFYSSVFRHFSQVGVIHLAIGLCVIGAGCWVTVVSHGLLNIGSHFKIFGITISSNYDLYKTSSVGFIDIYFDAITL